MINTIFLLLSSLVVINATCDDCFGCINGNIDKDALSFSNNCYKDNNYNNNPYFNIFASPGYNGCGYAKDINDTYNKCANECRTCRKIDKPCESITDEAYSTIICGSYTCSQRGDACDTKKGKNCCVGECLKLDWTGSKCVVPNQDCTPCGQKVETNKPCCDSSGINANGVWYCEGDNNKCKSNVQCHAGQDCRNGVCMTSR